MYIIIVANFIFILLHFCFTRRRQEDKIKIIYRLLYRLLKKAILKETYPNQIIYQLSNSTHRYPQVNILDTFSFDFRGQWYIAYVFKVELLEIAESDFYGLLTASNLL